MSTSALLVVTAILLGVEAYAWVGLRHLRNRLVGKRGHELSAIVVRLVGVTLVAQVVTTFNAILIAVDREGTIDARITLFIAVEAVQCSAVLWAFRRIRRLEARVTSDVET